MRVGLYHLLNSNIVIIINFSIRIFLRLGLGEPEHLHPVPVVQQPDLSELTVSSLEDGDDLPHPAGQLG